MQLKALILIGLLAMSANVKAQGLNKNTTDANLELIELLGGLGNFSDDTGDNSADDLEALEDAIQATETKNMTKKPTRSTPTSTTQDMILKDKSHPVGAEK